jgi:AAA+ lid domain
MVLSYLQILVLTLCGISTMNFIGLTHVPFFKVVGCLSERAENTFRWPPLGLPCDDDRKELLKRYLLDFDNDIAQNDDDLIELSESLQGWSGADLKTLTREAAMVPVREHRREARLRGDQLQQTEGTLSKIRPVMLNDFVEAHDVFKFVA